MSQLIIDEQIHHQNVLASLRTWITVKRILELRRDSVIKDESVPHLLRQLFRLPEFKTRAARMGKVVRVTLDHIRFLQDIRN